MDEKYIDRCLRIAVDAGERGDQPVGALIVSAGNTVDGANRIVSSKNRLLHAEVDALMTAYTKGIDTRGATLYSLVEPCHMCLGAALNAGVSRIVVALELRDIHPKGTIERRYGDYSVPTMLDMFGENARRVEYSAGTLKSDSLAVWKGFANAAWNHVIL